MLCPTSAGRDGPGRRWLARADTPNGIPSSQGNALSEPHSSVTPYTCETEIPFGLQMSGHSDNARLSATASVFDMAWWPNGMEVRCTMAFAVAGCRWVTVSARSTTPTLTTNRIIVNPSTNDPRTAIPFGRKTHALTRKCGQKRTRKALAREGGHAKRNPKLARERAIGTALFRHPIHLRDGDSVWPTNVRSFR